MACVTDTKFAAEKIAAITLAALRVQGICRSLGNYQALDDACLVDTWDEMRWVIEENIEKVIRKARLRKAGKEK